MVEQKDDDREQWRKREAKRRVICIAAAIIVARHIRNPDDLMQYQPSERMNALITNAVRIAARILDRIENAFF